jgi:16S rRNA (adenine1518-N6/adenine1519-N6)-dimethyltransferase
MISAYKKFGQNFLQDEYYLDLIARAVAVGPGENLLEIGPGMGALTRRLAERGFRLTAVEIDIRLVRELQKQFGSDGPVTVEHGDILRTDLHERAGEGGKLVLVGNIPYNITHLILLHILKSRHAVSRAYMMVQREVGERFLSPPGNKEYSFISAALQTFYRPEILFTVPPGAFRPRPKIDSCFVQLTAITDFDERIDNRNKYIRMLSNAFSHRRKKVINVLAGHYPRAAVQSFFTEQGLDENLRAENLPVETYVRLFQHLRESV